MTLKKCRLTAVALISIVLSACFLAPQKSYASTLPGPVAIDAGHGGADSGAVANGLVEKELNWKVANYCKQRLEALGISTVMVRTSPDENPSIYERCLRAYNAGARCLISFHFNSGGASANGAELLVGNESPYNYWTTQEGKSFANYLLPNFASVGIGNRGILQRDYGGGDAESYYPDGSMADYYGIVRYARRFNMTGNIIEHGFITNDHDANIFKNEDTLVQLGNIDANAIAAAWPGIAGEWIFDGQHWKWRYADGTYAVNCWLNVNGKTYFIESNGYRVQGWWHSWDNYDYYFDKDTGVVASDWATIDGKTYFFNKNDWYRLVKGWWTSWDNYRYYFDAVTGEVASGWVTIDGQSYYFDPVTHQLSTGWYQDSQGNTYYTYTNGTNASSWAVIDGKTYFFDPANGNKLVKGWFKSWDNYDYYFDKDTGVVASDWATIDGKTYFFNKNDWYRLVKGWWTSWDNYRYYFDAVTGEVASGWVTIDGQSYYFDPVTHHLSTFINTWTDSNGNPSVQTEPSTKVHWYDANGVLSWTRTTNTSAMSSSAMSGDDFVNSFSAKIAANYPSLYVQNSDYGATSPLVFAQRVWNAAISEGVRPEFLAAQVADETGWLKFGGAVPASACNFGGIGAVDSSPQSYAVFPNIQTGLLAQAQHIKAYSSTAALNNPCVDPRFHLVTRGIAPYIEDYGWGMWASNPTYNIDLLRIMNTILAG